MPETHAEPSAIARSRTASARVSISRYPGVQGPQHLRVPQASDRIREHAGHHPASGLDPVDGDRVVQPRS